MSQYEYADLIDRLINKELRFEALAAHEQYQFLEAAQERSLIGEYADICEENDDLNNTLRLKRVEIKELQDKVYLLNRKISDAKNYCSTWRNEASYKKAELIERMRKVETLLK